MTIDIATLGIKVDATSADAGAASLDRLSNSAEKAEASTKGAANATDIYADRVDKLYASVDPFGAKQASINAEIEEASYLFKKAAISEEQYEYAMSSLGKRFDTAVMQQKLYNATLKETAVVQKLTAAESLNLGRQFADVGVMAGMGMSPLMIAITQGPQIADIFKTAKMRGVETNAVFAQLIGNVAKFLPILTAVGAGAGFAFAEAGVAVHALNKNLNDTQAELGLTDKQMEKLKDSGEEMGATFGDVFAGLKTTIREDFTNEFGGAIDTVSGWWNDSLDRMATNAKTNVSQIVGAFVGAYNVVKDTWGMLPAAMSDLVVQAGNAMRRGLDDLINSSIDGINRFVEALPEWMKGPGARGIQMRSNLGQAANPNAGAASQTGEAAERAWAAGMRSGGDFVTDWGRNARSAHDSRLRTAAGDADKPHRDRAKGLSEEEKALKAATKAADSYLEGLTKETNEIGMNTVQRKLNDIALAADKAAKAGVDPAKVSAIRSGGQEWLKKTNDFQSSEMSRGYKEANDEIEFQNSLLAMNNEQQAEAVARREISIKQAEAERNGYTIVTGAIIEQTQRKIDLAKAEGKRLDLIKAANDNADNVGRLADNARAATDAFATLFGTAGQGFSELSSIVLDYYTMQADNEAKLASLREGSTEYLTEQKRQRNEAAEFEVESYAKIIHGVKSMFAEKSTAYKVAEAAERAYAVYRTAMQLKEIALEFTRTTVAVGGAAARTGADTAETAGTVARSGIRAAAHGVEAFARTLASLPFPLNLAAGAAVLAALVAVGVKIAGGGKSGATSAVADAASKEPTYSGPRDEYGNPTSGYSVLKPGATTVAGSNDNKIGSVSIGDTHITVNGNPDAETLGQLQGVLAEHRKQTVQEARQAAAQDRANANSRQRIGGAS